MREMGKKMQNKPISLLQLFPEIQQLMQSVSFKNADDSNVDLSAIKISGINEDSREIVSGDLFVARDGEHFKGSDYIESAAKNGALVAIVRNANTYIDSKCYSIPVIGIKDLEQRLGLIAAKIFGGCVDKLNIIGITGTNGKTSCAHFLAQALNSLGVNTFIIGTVGNGHPSALQEASRTTPDACSLHKLLAQFYQQGAQTVVMEVSSHALEQGRVAGVPFNVAAFTNLSRDHLDYHGSMQAYGQAKSLLFTNFLAKHKVLNLKDDFNKQLITRLREQGDNTLVTYSEDEHIAADYTAKQLNLVGGISFKLETDSGEMSVNTALIGQFNVANLLLCIAVLSRLGFSNQQVVESTKQLRTVPGRMQNIVCERLESQPLVVVDYAHTPDALQKALHACRVHCKERLLVVFGCGGDRDPGKRAEMAEFAEQYADFVYVTSDNPRTEDPMHVIDMVVAGLSNQARFEVLENRKEAIFKAVNMAGENDVVLVAGKGHEDYQEIMGVKHKFLDASVVLEALDTIANEQDKAKQVGKS
jgi:UDP-N-acetylmuramoyl-L-alanyl-D-glutamate--2,6-diaminopimelate ligase